MARGLRRKAPDRLGKRSPWLAVVFVLFTAFGAFMAVAGEGADRLWGVICFAFFGAGGLSVYVPKRAGGPGVAVERVEHRGNAWALAFPFDTRRRMVWTMAALVIGATGVTMVAFAEDLAAERSSRRASPGMLRVVGTVTAVFMGGVGALNLVRRRGPARMLLLEEGVELETAGSRTFVPWDAVEWAGLVSANGNDVLGITVDDLARIETSRIARPFLGLNRRFWGVDVTYPLNAFAADPLVVVVSVTRFVEHPEERARLATGDVELSELLPPEALAGGGPAVG